MSRRRINCLQRGAALASAWVFVAALAPPLAGLAAGAQGPGGGPPASPVRYTQAREHPLKRPIVLPGSVESRVSSVVASEVAGLVIELLAREGATVKKDEPLARLRTTPLELRRQAAEAQLKEADSRMKLAERNLERARELFQAKVFSQQQLDDATFEFTAWQGRVEQLRAEIAQIDLSLQQSTIRAPFAGVVVAERTEVGEWMDLGDPVVELVSLDDLEVRVEVPERYFRNLRPGTPATLEFESLPGLKVSGRVSAVIPRADPQSRTFPLKVRLPNREGRIGVGMLTQVSFAAGEPYRATVVPKDAVVSRGEQKLVYVINGDDTVAPINVQTGAGVGSWVEVQGGVRAGQRVVTRGNERLQPGQRVQGQPLAYQLP